MLEAVKLRGKIDANAQIVILDAPNDLPAGEVELILLYSSAVLSTKREKLSPLDWPALDGGQYLGGTLCREEIYGDDGR